MSAFTGETYDHDDAVTTITTTSERLRSRLREQCNQALTRLFPDHGIGVIADWNVQDVLQLTAIFELARVTRHAETERPLLTRSTILRVLNKLATAPPFHDSSITSLIEMEQHLRLLAASLRLYKYEGTSLNHDLRDQIYQGINKLTGKFQEDRRNCPSEKRIEQWNVAFLLQHCQYLLTSIDDSYSLGKKAAQKVFLVMDGALSGYGGQYIEAKKIARDIARRQRTRPKWHDEYMRLEDICFTIYTRGVGVEAEEVAANVIAELQSEEKEASLELRDSLEDQLIVEPGRGYTISEGWQRFVGKTTALTMESGPYEENAEYFKYGILDLMYELSYRVRNRVACFEEFVGVVKLVLERSHKSANLLHRKAIDLYQRINELGDLVNVKYGKDEERRIIDQWMKTHESEVEALEFSKLRSQRISSEITRIRATEKNLLRHSQSMDLRQTAREQGTDSRLRRRPVPQSTLQSEMFPQLPEDDPFHRNTLRPNILNSPISQSTLRSEIFPPLPEHEMHRRETLRPNGQNPVATPQLSNPISIPQQSRLSSFIAEPLRSSPEPMHSMLNEISDHPDDPDSIAKMAEFLKRHDMFRRVSEYINTAPSEYSAVPSQAYTATSPSISPQDESSNRNRRDSVDSYEPAMQRRETQDSYLLRLRRNDTYDSYTSTARFPAARQEPNGNVHSWMQLEPDSPPMSPPAVIRRPTVNLIDLSDNESEITPVPPPNQVYQSSLTPSNRSGTVPLTPSNSRSPPVSLSTSGTVPTSNTTRRSSIITIDRRSTLDKRPNLDRRSSLLNYANLAECKGPYELLTGSSARSARDVEFTAISATGQTVAVLTKSKFWVFETSPISQLCSAAFESKRVFKYGSRQMSPASQRPLPDKFQVSSFSCVAVSDEYLAIGTKEKIMIFCVSGDHAGRWIACDDITKAAITKLTFSVDGSQLVALVVVDDKETYEEARIYMANQFWPLKPEDKVRAVIRRQADLNPALVKWPRDFVHSPSGIAFSTKGTMVAICSTHSKARAEIRILKKEVLTWRSWGIGEVTVHTADHRDWHGLALTGIAFFQNDECLALSVDSTNPDAADCYRIVAERTHFRLEKASRIATGPRGTANLAIAVSQRYYAVALLNRDGFLQVKPDGQLLGSLSRHPHVHAHDPISISFDKTGTKLIFLDHHGNLEIYSFHRGALGVEKQQPLIPILDQQHML